MSQSLKDSGKTSPVARSTSWVVLRMIKMGEVATVSHGFVQSLRSLEPLHHGDSALMSTVLKKSWWARSFGTNEQPNKDRHILGAFFVNSDESSSSLFGTFLSYEELSFFYLSSVKTKHAAYLVYAVCVTLERDETDEQKMPALLTARAKAGMIDSAST